MMDHKVFLECGFPTIVQMLQITANASMSTVNLCTAWGKIRGEEQMLQRCYDSRETRYSMFHPYKLSKGLDNWGRMLDLYT